jgi:hypothetical protein
VDVYGRFEGSKNPPEAIKSYLKGYYRPRDPQQAWALGEALRPGVSWCNGFWMLSVCEHFQDFIGTAITWRAGRPREGNYAIESMWNMVGTAALLAEQVKDLDEKSPFTRFRVTKTDIDDETIQHLDAWRNEPLDQEGRRRRGEQADLFDLRERAKQVWMDYADLEAEIRGAFDSWMAKRRFDPRQSNDIDRLAELALGVAGERISLEIREAAALSLLNGWWNESVSNLGKTEFEQTTSDQIEYEWLTRSGEMEIRRAVEAELDEIRDAQEEANEKRT